MRCGLASLLLALGLFGCGGGEDGGAGTSTSAPTAASAGASAEPGSLEFELVEGSTRDYLAGEAAVSKECDELEWLRDEAEKRELAPFSGTELTEVLACDDVPYVAYLEYGSAGAAEEGTAGALLPYLVAEGTTIVMPLVALDEKVASAYLDSLAAECGCGEVVEPADR